MRNFVPNRVIKHNINMNFPTRFRSRHLISRSVVSRLVLLAAISVATHPGTFAATPQETTNSLVTKWTTMFGAVSFAEERLFAAMNYVHPQPDDAFRLFTTERMSKRYQFDLSIWLDELFTPAFATAVADLRPSKYYLNGGKPEPSLLRYEFKMDGHDIVMVENFNVFFLVVKPPNFSPQVPLNNRAVSEVISKWIKVRAATSQVDVVQRFKLTEQLRVGDVFTNRSQPDVGFIRSGRDHVIGFVSQQGICLMVFKAQENRSAAGFPADFNWLNRLLLQSDGMTPVDPVVKPVPASLPKAARPTEIK